MPGAPTDRRGNLHEAVLYDSDEEFLGVVVPFLQEESPSVSPARWPSGRRPPGSSGRPWEHHRSQLPRRQIRPARECDQIEPGALHRAPHRRRLADPRGE